MIRADRATSAVFTGKSTKADVIASLGETLVIGFDTGYEIWIYRLTNETRGKAGSAQRSRSEKAAPGMSAEFVILFEPSGVVAKTRIRPAPQTAG
jgi:hypothetical protein